MATRIFVYDSREFPDPDPNMTVDEARQYYAVYYPELSNAEIKESKRTQDGVEQIIVTMTKRVGTKGALEQYHAE